MSSSILFPTNEFAACSKSSEEIQRLSMPLFEHTADAVTHILAKGLPPQFVFVYANVHKAHRVALSVVCAKAPGETTENQMLIACSLRKLMKEKGQQLGEEELEMIFSSSLECLNNLQSPANEELGKVMEIAIRIHPNNRKLIRRLEETALELGKPSQPIISKVTSGRLISMLAVYLGRTIKGEMIDIVKRVLSDNEIEVRKVWVSQIFPRLLRNLELEFIELHLQEKIYEAVWDEHEEIAALALQSILRNTSRFSAEEQSSRVVKLFIDSLTSKRERIMVLATEMLGETYQKLLNCILGNEQLCLRFWKALIELSSSKNEKVLSNLTYNLPGILVLSSKHYKVDPFCDIYIQLFYQPHSNKVLLASYFHEIVLLFPTKWPELRELAYWMFAELFQEDEPVEEAVRIVQKLLHRLPVCKGVFLEGEGEEKYFDLAFCDYLMNFFQLLQTRKTSLWLSNLHLSFRDCSDCFNHEFVEATLLPRLYQSLRSKPAGMEQLAEALVRLVIREASAPLINAYTSKISVELCKSSKSYEREAALLFFYYATFYCSMELFQEYRLGEKYLAFNVDKNFKVRTAFIKRLPRLTYFLTREEKIELAIILSRLAKDPDYEIRELMAATDFQDNESTRQALIDQSRHLKEREKEKALVLTVRKQNMNRRSSKEIKKEDVLKKRIETTKSKTKMVIKEVTKMGKDVSKMASKEPIGVSKDLVKAVSRDPVRRKVAPMLVKTSSAFNFRKNS